jgi:1-acyl-sn-glycerol-3-phosphate acyltransferase
MIFPEGRLNLEQKDMLAFKSGFVLMAHRAGKPIVPFYIVKGEKWYNRWEGVIGDPIDVRELCGRLPTLEKVNEVCALLKQKEEELKAYYEEIQAAKRAKKNKKKKSTVTE